MLRHPARSSVERRGVRGANCALCVYICFLSIVLSDIHDPAKGADEANDDR
jgi:hypothetical protein